MCGMQIERRKMNHNKLLIFSGAGLSADSGIATFRGQDGMWNNHNIKDVCHIDYWKMNKELVFQFYNERRAQLFDVTPNAAHFAIAELEKELGTERVFNITTNVDDLLESAGCSNVLHVHGNLKEMQCLSCGKIWDVGFEETYPYDECQYCGDSENVKPNVVFFGENAPLYRRMYGMFDSIGAGDVALIIGASGVVLNVGYMIPAYSHNILVTKEIMHLNTKNFNRVEIGNASEIVPTLKQGILDILNKS